MAKIMLVDDSLTLLLSMAGILSKAGYDVTKANSGQEALTALRSGFKPDLVITDLNMPGMDGITLIKSMRNAGLRFTPILMLTTESQQSMRMEAKKAGATGWLVKPIKPEDLLGVIKKVLPGA
jgi:two-component system chemotaxis response regulator CheY